MDQLRSMRVLKAVVDEGGFAAAARRLGVSAAAVTRAVDALEAHLGVAVLRRTTRAVSLTDVGARYLEAARRVLADLEEADRAASGAAARPTGEIAVTAPVAFGRLYVAPLAVAFLEAHPGARVTLTLLDRPTRLIEEGFDLGFRIGALADGSLPAVQVGTVRRIVCASPHYLARRGAPASPRDLAGHDLVELSAMAAFGPAWSFREAGRKTAPRLVPRLRVNDAEAAVAAAERGLGIVRLLSYQVAASLEAGRLVPILVDFERAPVPIHILFGCGRPTAVVVRAFVDLSKARLSGRLS